MNYAQELNRVMYRQKQYSKLQSALDRMEHPDYYLPEEEDNSDCREAEYGNDE